MTELEESVERLRKEVEEDEDSVVAIPAADLLIVLESREVFRQAFARYGGHLPYCPTDRDPRDKCTCGFTGMEAAAGRATAEEHD